MFKNYLIEIRDFNIPYFNELLDTLKCWFYYKFCNTASGVSYGLGYEGVDEETIRNYVEHQGQQDSGQLRMKL